MRSSNRAEAEKDTQTGVLSVRRWWWRNARNQKGREVARKKSLTDDTRSSLAISQAADSSILLPSLVLYFISCLSHQRNKSREKDSWGYKERSAVFSLTHHLNDQRHGLEIEGTEMDWMMMVMVIPMLMVMRKEREEWKRMVWLGWGAATCEQRMDRSVSRHHHQWSSRGDQERMEGKGVGQERIVKRWMKKKKKKKKRYIFIRLLQLPVASSLFTLCPSRYDSAWWC